MNPVYKIVAVRSLQASAIIIGIRAFLRKFLGLSNRATATEATVIGLGMTAYFLSVFVGSFKLGYPRLMTRLPVADRLRKVALTFDDGPDPESTPAILDILRETGSRATFFVLIDAAAKHPDLVQRIVDEGHKLGIHGVTHDAMPLWSVRQVRQTLKTARRALAPYTDHVRFFRPPYGFKSHAMQLACDHLGMTLVTWSVNPKDYFNMSYGELFKRAALKPRYGDIVVLHDGRPLTVEALPDIIKKLKGRGFRLVSL